MHDVPSNDSAWHSPCVKHIAMVGYMLDTNALDVIETRGNTICAMQVKAVYEPLKGPMLWNM